jgi:4-hydroxyphenylacetate 3-monooxygenase
MATYTALQRAALLQMAWDYVASAFERYASGGVPAWRGRLLRSFERYNALANAVLHALNMDMPDMDLSSLREVPWAPRRHLPLRPGQL